MQFTDSTPRTSAVYQGFKIQVPQIFNAENYEDLVTQLQEQKVTPLIASRFLQQTMVLENPRNNVASKIKDLISDELKSVISQNPEAYLTSDDDSAPLAKATDDGIILSWDGKIDSIPDDLKRHLIETLSAPAQAAADAYLREYTPALPRRRGESGPSLDPIEDLAQKNAATGLYASWKDTIWADHKSTRWQGVKSHDRQNSAHRAANEMLAEGQRPAFMSDRVFEAFDGEINTVSDYVNAYVSCLFSDDAKPAGKAKADRLRQDAKDQLDRIAAAAQVSATDDEI